MIKNYHLIIIINILFKLSYIIFHLFLSLFLSYLNFLSLLCPSSNICFYFCALSVSPLIKFDKSFLNLVSEGNAYSYTYTLHGKSF